MGTDSQIESKITTAGREGKGEMIEPKEKGLMDMDNSVVIVAGGRRDKRTKWQWKKYNKRSKISYSPVKRNNWLLCV